MQELYEYIPEVLISGIDALVHCAMCVGELDRIKLSIAETLVPVIFQHWLALAQLVLKAPTVLRHEIALIAVREGLVYTQQLFKV